MNNILLGVELMGYGIFGVFSVLIIFYVMIVLIRKLLPDKRQNGDD